MADYIIILTLAISSVLAGITGILKLPNILLELGLYYQLSGILTKIHDWSGLIMGIMAISHVVINWRRLVGFTKRIAKFKHGRNKVVTLGLLSIIFTAAIPIGFSLANYQGIDPNFRPRKGGISFQGIGGFNFLIAEVQTQRPDIFNPDHFSIFDVVAYLDSTDQLDVDYYFNSSMNTYVIESINGRRNWWYYAYYDGGWQETNVFRMDHFPFKPKMRIVFFRENKDRITNIYRTFTEEVDRLNTNNGELIIPTVIITADSRYTFQDVEVTAHNLRNDVFRNGVITAIDVIMSLGDMGLITYELQWYDIIGYATVRTYFVVSIQGKDSAGTCGFVYEAGDDNYKLFSGNHIHIPSDIRVINTHDYVEWFYICI
jgi:hypothetical protein